MLNEKKFIHNNKLKDDYSDFQFISSWEKNYKSWKYQNNFPIKLLYEDLNKKNLRNFQRNINFIDQIRGIKIIFRRLKQKFFVLPF